MSIEDVYIKVFKAHSVLAKYERCKKCLWRESVKKRGGMLVELEDFDVASNFTVPKYNTQECNNVSGADDESFNNSQF